MASAAAPTPCDGLTGLADVARTAIARTLQAEMRLADAWKAIEPRLDGYQGDALA
jgi:hypothetical protein